MQPGASSATAQQARTLEVSREGAMIECRSKFEPGAEVMIHNPKNLQNGFFKVKRANLSPTGSAWNIAVELQESGDENFWGLAEIPDQLRQPAKNQP